jgi:hypothetical protein
MTSTDDYYTFGDYYKPAEMLTYPEVVHGLRNWCCKHLNNQVPTTISQGGVCILCDSYKCCLCMDFHYFEHLSTQAKHTLHHRRNEKRARKIDLSFYTIDNQNADMVGLCTECVSKINTSSNKYVECFKRSAQLVAEATLMCVENAWTLLVDCVFSTCWYLGRKMDNYEDIRRNKKHD